VRWFAVLVALLCGVMGNSVVERERARRDALLNSLFPEQLAAVQDPSPKKVLWTTRRAGKTTTVLTDFMDDARRNPGFRYAYIALTQGSAEDIAWPILQKLNNQFRLNASPQEHKLRMKFPNGSSIKLYGADRPGWMNKLYGQQLRKVAVDEAAFFTVSLEDLVEDYLEPATIDLDGTIYLMSIPGHLPRGLFYHITKQFPVELENWRLKLDGKQAKQTEECPSGEEWTVHRWTTMDNPAMAERFLKRLELKRKKQPNIDSDPKFIRNYRGIWHTDIGERVYAFDWDKNKINEYEPPPGSRFLLGIDFGWDDRTAFSLITWHKNSPLLVELESHSAAEMRMDVIASWVRAYMDAYPGLSIVGDPAHKQFFEEFRRRYQFPLMEGEKPNKFDWIQTINSDLLAGNILFLDAANSPHVKEMNELPWLRKKDGKLIEQPGKWNDCCDAFMLAFRQAYHYRFETLVEKPKPGTPEHNDMIEAEIERQVEEQYEMAVGDWDV
jgi:hypothetical protein